MHFDNCTNLMKAAILVSDRVSTVSHTYAFEIQNPYFAHGLHDVLRQHVGAEHLLILPLSGADHYQLKVVPHQVLHRCDLRFREGLEKFVNSRPRAG